MKIPLIISTDCALGAWWYDPDDALALLHLLNDPSIDVKAIITTFGHTSEKQVFHSLGCLFEELGLQRRIVRGAQHKKDRCVEATAFLNELKNPEEHVLLSIGSLTNFHQLSAPKLQSFKKMYVMGGALKKGNVAPLFKKEVNFSRDAVSAQHVLDSRTIELIPLETTRKIQLHPAIVKTVSDHWPKIGRHVQRWNAFKKLVLGHYVHPHDISGSDGRDSPLFFYAGSAENKPGKVPD